MSSLSLTLMDRDPGYFPESYSSLYNPVVDDSHHMQYNDIRDDLYPSSCDTSKVAAFTMHPNMSIDIDYIHAPFDDVSYVPNALYHLGDISTNQRQHPGQQLYIDTQLEPYQTNDSGSSTASSGWLLSTPYSGYPDAQSAIHISSPHSAPAVSGMLISDSFQHKSPIPPSPSSYNPSYMESEVFEPNLTPLPIAASDVETQVPMPHILEWKRVVEDYGTKDFVPQTVYQPYTEADRKRYIREVELQPTILFQSDDPFDMGIRLDDALKQRLKNLQGRDERMFVHCGPSVSIRIQWPGYQSWSKQIPTKDFRNPKGPITKAKLAKNIATCIKHFIEDMQGKPMEAESDKRWKVGERYIKVEDLILVSLHHVSKGSWQPQLRLRRAPFFY
ncbi:hypothetical protein JVU11DRAFT_6361 [Chiua virens]|nr:hypothetical protein JVU11DRAFT_6361 [Chiua virens]